MSTNAQLVIHEVHMTKMIRKGEARMTDQGLHILTSENGCKAQLHTKPWKPEDEGWSVTLYWNKLTKCIVYKLCYDISHNIREISHELSYPSGSRVWHKPGSKEDCSSSTDHWGLQNGYKINQSLLSTHPRRNTQAEINIFTAWFNKWLWSPYLGVAGEREVWVCLLRLLPLWLMAGYHELLAVLT